MPNLHQHPAPSGLTPVTEVVLSDQPGVTNERKQDDLPPAETAATIPKNAWSLSRLRQNWLADVQKQGSKCVTTIKGTGEGWQQYGTCSQRGAHVCPPCVEHLAYMPLLRWQSCNERQGRLAVSKDEFTKEVEKGLAWIILGLYCNTKQGAQGL